MMTVKNAVAGPSLQTTHPIEHSHPGQTNQAPSPKRSLIVYLLAWMLLYLKQ